ncbi:MAG: AbrB family transcriptional regulator [Rhodospirillaceae bacterium]
MPAAFSVDALKRLTFTLPIGIVGALLFLWATLPVPWMLGPMSFTVIAALIGLKVGVPKPLRNVALAIVGSMIGTAFSPAILDHLSTWLVVILYNYAYLITVISAGTFFFYKICRQNVTTAFFSSSPGGLMEMPFLCEAVGGDARFASMVHSIRVVIVVLAVPIYIRFAEAASYAAKAVVPEVAADLAAIDAIILVAAAVVGYLVAKQLRIPAPALVGPMLAGVIVHLFGWTEAKPPEGIFSAAQLVVGASIGGYFVGVTILSLGRITVYSLVWTVILLLIAAGFAHLGTHVLDVDFNVLFLALSPGGQAEMALVALFMGIEVPLIATVHIFRSMSIYAIAPLVFKFFKKAKQQ